MVQKISDITPGWHPKLVYDIWHNDVVLAQGVSTISKYEFLSVQYEARHLISCVSFTPSDIDIGHVTSGPLSLIIIEWMKSHTKIFTCTQTKTFMFFPLIATPLKACRKRMFSGTMASICSFFHSLTHSKYQWYIYH